MATSGSFMGTKIRKYICNTVCEKLCLIVRVFILNASFPINRRKTVSNIHISIFIIPHSSLAWRGDFNIKVNFRKCYAVLTLWEKRG